MRSLPDLILFSKSQSGYHSKKGTERGLKPYQIKKHREAYEGLTEITAFLESLPSDVPPADAKKEVDIFALDPFDLSNIPDELVEELKISRAEKADAQILELFRYAQRPLNISEVLIGLYRMFTVSEKRTAISARLYRLTQADQLESVEGERGVYKLAEKAKPAG